ncbi:hypothetical protein D3C72_1299500 [compost metagenome]
MLAAIAAAFQAVDAQGVVAGRQGARTAEELAAIVVVACPPHVIALEVQRHAVEEQGAALAEVDAAAEAPGARIGRADAKVDHGFESDVRAAAEQAAVADVVVAGNRRRAIAGAWRGHGGIHDGLVVGGGALRAGLRIAGGQGDGAGVRVGKHTDGDQGQGDFRQVFHDGIQ